MEKGKTSKYKGVWWLSREKTFMAAIKINGRRKVCGYFANQVNAAHARDLVAREAGMPESTMNFPKKGDLLDWKKARRRKAKEIEGVSDPQKRIELANKAEREFEQSAEPGWVINNQPFAKIRVEARREIGK